MVASIRSDSVCCSRVRSTGRSLSCTRSRHAHLAPLQGTLPTNSGGSSSFRCSRVGAELLAHGRTRNIGFGVRVMIPRDWRVCWPYRTRFFTSVCPPAQKTEPIDPTAAREQRRNHSCPPRNILENRNRSTQSGGVASLELFHSPFSNRVEPIPHGRPKEPRIGVLHASLNRQDKPLTMQLLRRSAQRQAAV